MKGEEIRNGVRVRKHFATSTKISEDGLFVEKEFIDKQDGNKLKTYNPKIKVDEEGLRYIDNKNLGRVYIQDLVADCFCAPKPNDGNYYVLVHKDGNLQNDHYKNLEWTDYNVPRYKEYYNRTVDEKNRLGREWNGEEKWSYMEKDQRFRHI